MYYILGLIPQETARAYRKINTIISHARAILPPIGQTNI